MIGFTTTEDFTGRQTFAFVVEQLFVQGSYIHPTERMETLIPEMIKLGFKYKIENLKPIFFNKEYIIRDLHERNILITQEGNLRFIDTVPELNVPTSGFGGIRESFMPSQEILFISMISQNIRVFYCFFWQ